jgi:hypothetical protein
MMLSEHKKLQFEKLTSRWEDSSRVVNPNKILMHCNKRKFIAGMVSLKSWSTSGVGLLILRCLSQFLLYQIEQLSSYVAKLSKVLWIIFLVSLLPWSLLLFISPWDWWYFPRYLLSLFPIYLIPSVLKNIFRLSVWVSLLPSLRSAGFCDKPPSHPSLPADYVFFTPWIWIFWCIYGR